MVHPEIDCDDSGCMGTTEPTEASSVLDSTTGKVLIGIVLSFVIFLSIFGNVLVCLAVYTDRNLRKIGNLFVVSLAIADLFVACVVMTFALVNDLMGRWPFGPKYCDTWIAFDVMCSTASIVNLCAISLDRYIHIKDPLRYGRWMTKRIVTCSIAGIWLLSALVSFLPIGLGLHRPTQTDEEEVNFQCALDLTPTYAVVSSCISFFLPCCVMLGIYSRLYLYAKKHVESIRALVRPVTLGSLEGDTSRPKKVANPCHVSESKAATTVGIIVGTFLTCWVPFFCVNIVSAFCKTCISKNAFKVLTWFGYTNSSFNPIIYSIFNQEFREAFTRILTSRCRPCPSCCCCCCYCCYKDPSGFPSTPVPFCSRCCFVEKKLQRKTGDTLCGKLCERKLQRKTGDTLCGNLCERRGRLGGTNGASGVAGSHSCLEVPRPHQNGSSSTALTEYTVLDASATPRFSHDRSRASSGERCLILEQISAI